MSDLRASDLVEGQAGKPCRPGDGFTVGYWCHEHQRICGVPPSSPSPKPEGSHAFYATRKGTPKGVAGTWANRCDECGEGVDAPIHAVSNAENGATLLRALEDSDAD